MIYENVDCNIKVTVCPKFLDDQSEDEDDHFVWAYCVKLENLGNTPVQLLARYWKITNGSGDIQEVRGQGVVGQQPLLKPGHGLEYVSGTSLDTPSGVMSGMYTFSNEQGKTFDVSIPDFLLESPYAPRVLH